MLAKPSIDEFHHDSCCAPIPGWPDYLACKDGTIWSSKRFGKWKQVGASKPGPRGYWVVRLTNGPKFWFDTVHAIIMFTFVGPRPKGFHVRHLDGNKSNNRLDNLAYGTPAENANDTLLHGRRLFGETTPRSKLTTEDVLEIRRMGETGFVTEGVARRFGVTGKTISDALRGRSWSHLPLLQFREARLKKSDDLVNEVRRRHHEGEPIRQIAESLGISVRLAWAYIEGKIRRSLAENGGVPLMDNRRKSIIMSEAEVAELIARGKATVTRKVKTQPCLKPGVTKITNINGGFVDESGRKFPSPLGQIGEIRYVRETAELSSFCGHNVPGATVEIRYKADLECREFSRSNADPYDLNGYKGPPSMPQWASRFDVETVDVGLKRESDLLPWAWAIDVRKVQI